VGAWVNGIFCERASASSASLTSKNTLDVTRNSDAPTGDAVKSNMFENASSAGSRTTRSAVLPVRLDRACIASLTAV
jgi:hypothetical protein